MDINITPEFSKVNFEALDAALSTALGDTYGGMDIGGGLVVVHLKDGAEPTAALLARNTVLQHDSTVLTAEQQATLAKRAQIETLKAQVEADSAKPLTLDILLKRIELLELTRSE
jgi:hypothetical protein